MRITKEQLLKTLADISAAIEINDSFEVVPSRQPTTPRLVGRSGLRSAGEVSKADFMTRLLRLAHAHCPDVPRNRETRFPQLHKLRVEVPEHDLGTSLCGRIANASNCYFNSVDSSPSTTLSSICQRCLKNTAFAKEVADFFLPFTIGTDSAKN